MIKEKKDEKVYAIKQLTWVFCDLILYTNDKKKGVLRPFFGNLASFIFFILKWLQLKCQFFLLKITHKGMLERESYKNFCILMIFMTNEC